MRHPAGQLSPSSDGLQWSVQWPSSVDYPASTVAVDGELTCLHRDAYIVVVEKPAYLPSENTLVIKDSVRSRMERLVGSTHEAVDETKRTVYLPHRLDWETSGLLVIALCADAMRSLSEQFAERRVHKVYVADVMGGPPTATGTIELPLAADSDRRPCQLVDFGAAGRHARTEWQTVSQTFCAAERGAATDCIAPHADLPPNTHPYATRLRLSPDSGRRHQLRMHCLALGCPIAGDGLYEAPPQCDPVHCGTRPSRMHLHAAELSFAHPATGEPMSFTSEPPFQLADATRWADSRAWCLR